MIAWSLAHANKVSLDPVAYQLITNRLGPLIRQGFVTLAISLACYGYTRRRVLAVGTRESLCCHRYYFLSSFESVATPGSKNTLKELSGVRAALGDIPNTLALVTKMAVVPNRSGEIFDMAHTVMILKVK